MAVKEVEPAFLFRDGFHSLVPRGGEGGRRKLFHESIRKSKNVLKIKRLLLDNICYSSNIRRSYFGDSIHICST